MTRIAVLMTCFNRRALTLRCLAALFAEQSNECALDVFLVDDGSTDGTAEAVAKDFPAVRILAGTGHLYWTRGMHLAFAEALPGSYDHFLWLNDDTLLLPGTLKRLLTISQEIEGKGGAAIVVGNTQDPKSGEQTYGGLIRRSRLNPVSFRVAPNIESLQSCDSFEGNCVLIPRRIAESIGNLDPTFQHNFGDVDYGLRARCAGFSIFAAPGYAGFCEAHPSEGSWHDVTVPFKTRWNILMSPKGCPWSDWVHFTGRHGGALFLVLAICPYLKTLLGSAVRGKLR